MERRRALPRPLDPLTLLLGLPLVALVLGAGAARADPGLPDAAEARSHGIASLPRVLALVEADDPDLRMRARRLATALVLDFLRSKEPQGMALVAGRIVFEGRQVRVEGGYYLGRTEVTVGAFRRFAQSRGWPLDLWSGRDSELPVTDVSLAQARAYAEACEARLPTLGEFADAATGGGRFRYPWGDRFDPTRLNSREAGRGAPLPVGSLADGANGLGVRDLLGNVAEWTETVHGSGRSSNPRYLVVGGSFDSYARSKDLVTYRLSAESHLPDVGFRLARSLPRIPDEYAAAGGS